MPHHNPLPLFALVLLFKDLKNEQWAREFELGVTNTGTKSIYSLYLYVVTDIKAAAGFRIVFPLYYGRDELGDIRTKAEPTDIPIKPGESVSLKIHPALPRKLPEDEGAGACLPCQIEYAGCFDLN
jgi:hypothetical protein